MTDGFHRVGEACGGGPGEEHYNVISALHKSVRNSAAARAPKSNVLYVALGEEEEDVAKTAADPVPLHLRNATTALMKGVG